MNICVTNLQNYEDYGLQFLKQINETWTKGPIKNITLTKFGEKCPKNSEIFLSTLYNGNKEGCFCTDSEEIYNMPCNYLGNLNSSSCININSGSNFPMTVWNGNNICVERSKINYFSPNIFNDNCPNIFSQKCGIIDSVGNYLCLSSDTDCPINLIQIVDSDTSSINKDKSTIVEFDSSSETSISSISKVSKFLIYNNKNTDNLIINNALIEESQPCLINNYHKNDDRYFLDSFNILKDCPVIRINTNKTITSDRSYKIIDTNIYSNILKDNHLYDIVKSLPMYPERRLLKVYNLFMREYYGLKAYCRNKILNNWNNIISSQFLVSDFYFTFIKFCLFSHDIIFLILILDSLVVLLLEQRDLPKLFYVYEYTTNYRLFLMIFVTYSVFLLLVIYISFELYRATNLLYFTYLLYDCFDDNTNILISFIVGIINETYNLLLYSLIMELICFALYMLYFKYSINIIDCYVIAYNKIKKKEDENEKKYYKNIRDSDSENILIELETLF